MQDKYKSYIRVDGKREGRGNLKAPSFGCYDLRFFQDNGYSERNRSMPFRLGPEMKIHAELCGKKILVAWDRRKERKGDWIGLFSASVVNNSKHVQSSLISAAKPGQTIISFNAPREPGEYEVRYFFSGGNAYSGLSEVIIISR